MPSRGIFVFFREEKNLLSEKVPPPKNHPLTQGTGGDIIIAKTGALPQGG